MAARDHTVREVFQRLFDSDSDADAVVFIMESDGKRETFQVRVPTALVNVLTDAQLDDYIQHTSNWSTHQTEEGSRAVPLDTDLDTRLQTYVGRTFTGVP